MSYDSHQSLHDALDTAGPIEPIRYQYHNRFGEVVWGATDELSPLPPHGDEAHLQAGLAALHALAVNHKAGVVSDVTLRQVHSVSVNGRKWATSDLRDAFNGNDAIQIGHGFSRNAGPDARDHVAAVLKLVP